MTILWSFSYHSLENSNGKKIWEQNSVISKSVFNIMRCVIKGLHCIKLHADYKYMYMEK